MSTNTAEKLDPRVKRTREALEQAFAALVAEAGFTALSVQAVAERAGVNRATFYAHFPDKYALLDYAVEVSFRRELDRRTLGQCAFSLDNLHALVVTVCEFIGTIHTPASAERQYQLLAEAQVREQVYALMLHWLEGLETIRRCTVSRERAATAASWAIYGLAHQWAHEKRRPAPEKFADEIMPLVSGTLGETIELEGA